MDTASLRQRLTRIVHTHSSVFAASISRYGFSCARCGWCCRENFKIRITKDISRPSNAISVFPLDIRRIIKGTGLHWDEIAEPDIYSCLDDGKNIRAIGWILRRSDKDECIFYGSGGCNIYESRPLICRCYPFLMGEQDVEIMHCEGGKSRIETRRAKQIALLVKRYELQKLRNYIGIISQLGNKLRLADLHPLPNGYSGEVIVCDGERSIPVKVAHLSIRRKKTMLAHRL